MKKSPPKGMQYAAVRQYKDNPRDVALYEFFATAAAARKWIATQPTDKAWKWKVMVYV